MQWVSVLTLHCQCTVQSFCHLLCMSFGIFVMSVLVYLNSLTRITSLVCFASSIGSWPRQKKPNCAFYCPCNTYNAEKRTRISSSFLSENINSGNYDEHNNFRHVLVPGSLRWIGFTRGSSFQRPWVILFNRKFFLSFEVHWGHWHRAYRCLSSLCALNYHIWHVLK